METTLANNTEQDFLNRFENVTESGDQFLVKCPCHNDETGSLAVRFTPEGKVLLHCHAGCPTPEIVKALGLNMKDLSCLLSSPLTVGTHLHIPGEPSETINKSDVHEPVGVQSYALHKRLPEAFLKEQGLSDHFHKGLQRDVLRVPYLDASGVERATRYRVALEGDSKFRWRKRGQAFPVRSLEAREREDPGVRCSL